MLYEYATGSQSVGDSVTFSRIDSGLATSKSAPPVFSILVGPGLSSALTGIPRGFPMLPDPGSKLEMRLLESWASDCNKNHECLNNSTTHQCGPEDGEHYCPTRLIDVGEGNKTPSLKLDCPKDGRSRKYIALSYRWGDKSIHEPFCTYKDNLEQRQKSIDFNEMPRTYQDAVTVTRSLGIRYLWIDSLCIIQQNEEDWKAESKRMEDVFSCAYLTIAASRAEGTTDGFLKPRPVTGDGARVCRALDSGVGAPPQSVFYVCNVVDDFQRDVEQGRLSRRGWVYQERALSRRTIHFTETQIYWECGRGVRYETLTEYDRPSLFSDPDFPSAALKQPGGKIMYFQQLYEMYSRLDFTENTDRSLGIAGLERRLATAYRTPAEFGILHQFLHRSLLWQRDNSTATMPKVPYTNDRKVPSWSWMAVEGGIKYVEAPFERVYWNQKIRSPLAPRAGNPVPSTATLGDLSGPAFDFSSTAAEETVFDRPEDARFYQNTKGIVIGTKTQRYREIPLVYVIVVVPLSGGGDFTDYERVGVAVMKKDPKMDEPGRDIRVL